MKVGEHVWHLGCFSCQLCSHRFYSNQQPKIHFEHFYHFNSFCDNSQTATRSITMLSKTKLNAAKSNMTKSPQVLRWGKFPARASGPLSSVSSKVLKQNFHVMQSFPQTKFLCHAKCSSNEIFMSRKLFLKRNFRVMQSIVGTKFPCDARRDTTYNKLFQFIPATPSSRLKFHNKCV